MFILQVGYYLVGFLLRGAKLVQDFAPVSQRLAGFLDHLIISDIPVIRLHSWFPSESIRIPSTGKNLPDVDRPDKFPGAVEVALFVGI